MDQHGLKCCIFVYHSFAVIDVFCCLKVYNDILKNRKIKKEKRKVKKHIVNVNGIDFVVDKQTMYQIRCASKELERVMEAGDIPDVSV